MLLKIGELARRTGLTVRTLHHYDAIGLLSPSARSEAGYRLYDRQDIGRLHRIQALRRLDLSLAEIARLLEGDHLDLQTVIAQQIAALEQQAQRALHLRDRLAALRTRIDSRDEKDLGEWLDTLAMMAVYDRYFTPAELDRLRLHGQPDMAALDKMIAKVRRLMQRGVPPASPEALRLAKPWLTLSLQYMAGDARLIHKFDLIHRKEEEAHLLTGVDAAMLDYMTRVTAEFRLSLYARHVDGAAIDRVRERFHRHYLDWPPLFAEARELHESGAAADSPAVLDFAARWVALFRAIWGDDPRLRLQVREANAREPDIMAGSGMEPAILELINQGITHLMEQA
jgi:DNA-binding transcriptional MerR regulator